jgi:hypothetical protein
LLSDDLSYAFRLEKLAGDLKLPSLLSAAAAAQLSAHLPLTPVSGSHAVKGFPAADGFMTLNR